MNSDQVAIEQAARLRRRRRAEEITQIELAPAACISRFRLNQGEKGRLVLTSDEMNRIDSAITKLVTRRKRVRAFESSEAAVVA